MLSWCGSCSSATFPSYAVHAKTHSLSFFSGRSVCVYALCDFHAWLTLLISVSLCSRLCLSYLSTRASSHAAGVG